jgi:hypothetical protein
MTDPIWWERRRTGEPTNEYLARVLTAAGLDDMATRARAYHFDDFRAPDDIDCGDNMIRLHHELLSISTKSTRDQRLRLRVIANAVVEGEFDSTKEESEQWAKSFEGLETVKEFGPLAERYAKFLDAWIKENP